MENRVIEAKYPLSFRETEARELGQHIRNGHSVVLIGMKRVGISNFLRFFLYNKEVVDAYIADGKKHLFVRVDLNDLVERELFPFWTLTLKRIVDASDKSELPQEVKKDIQGLFLDSIQSQDLFLTIDSVRQAVNLIVEAGFLPTIFFLRFDRIKDAVTPEFFNNVQGLRDSLHHKLTYVFTSYRSLDKLSPQVFNRASLSVFSHDMYIKPAKHEDTRIVYQTYQEQYKLPIDAIEEGLFEIVDGYIQYLQLALVSLQERNPKPASKEELFALFVQDERMILQSEELWESLEGNEQAILLKILIGQDISEQEQASARYLWDMGFVIKSEGKQKLFSPLFASFVSQKQQKEKTKSDTNGGELSKKEHLLFSFLESHKNSICEREQIIESVWPEAEALGVSDWAIDRLVARVRQKLKLQKSQYEILTVKTRGYKLVEISRA